MKIALVHNLTSGGARRRVLCQVAAFGEDVQLREYTLSGSCPVTDDPTIVRSAQVAERVTPVFRVLFRYLDLATLVVAYTRLSRTIARDRPDVVWINPCQFLQAPMVWNSIPTVYYCDEPRRADYDKGARALLNPVTLKIYGPLRAGRRWLDRSSVRRVDRLATNSQFTASAIRTAYGREATMVSCGVQAHFGPAPAPRDTRHVLSVGTLIPTKGHDLAIRALATSRIELPLVVVAPRYDAAEYDRLTSLAESLGVQLDVRVGISDPQLVDLYQTAFVTLYLAVAEPLGLASLEAQACGCPVIVSAEGGLPETLDEGITGWAVTREPEAAAARLNALGEPGVRAQMVLACGTLGLRQSWTHSAEQLRALFDDAVR